MIEQESEPKEYNRKRHTTVLLDSGETSSRRHFLKVAMALGVAGVAVLAPTPLNLLSPSDVFAQTNSPDIVNVTVNPSRRTGMNNLSLGFMIDHDWNDYVTQSARKDLSRNANFKLVRVFDYKSDSPKACVSWDENMKTGVFDWSDFDLLTKWIFDAGAEPLFCLGGYDASGPQIPAGMAVDPNTKLPNPASFAAYASEWVTHFRQAGLPVRYYEIINEPWNYFVWDPVDFGKLSNYMQLYNATASSMRQLNPNVSISFDFVCRKPVLDYWLANGGADVDSLNFHKYDSYVVGQYSDAQMIERAESQYFGQWPLGYSLGDARQAWYNARGKMLPIINSEGNFNSAFEGGTDPRIQQMVGAVWTALGLRMSILNGVSYSIYYMLSDSLSYGSTLPTGGAGFGMTNSDNNRPWYPYYVHYMLGNNLSVGDQLVETSSSSEDIATLGWIHNGGLNVLLICKVDQPRTLQIQGLASQLPYLKIDNTIPWQTPDIQSGLLDPTKPLSINGYTIALLQSGLIPQRRV